MTKKESYNNLHNLNASLAERSYDFRDDSLAKLMLKGLNGKSVLDVGCGSGYYMNYFSKNGFDVKGLEPNPDMVNECKRLFGKCFVVNDIAENVPKHFKKSSFDNMVMIDVLEHIENDVHVLKQCHNILKGKGRLVIVVPAYQWLWGKRDVRYGHYRRYGEKQLKKLVVSSGFRILKLRYWNTSLLLPYALMRNAEMEKSYIKMRSKGGKTNAILGWFFRNIENRINFGFGISLICFAEKI